MIPSIPGGPDELRKALSQAHAATAEGHYLQRLYGLLLVSEGHSGAEVARWFGVDAHTVTRWVRAFADQGLDGVRDHRLGGRPPTLSDAQLEQLSLLSVAAPGSSATTAGPWTGKQLQQFLAQQHGVVLGVRQCQRLLGKLSAPPAPSTFGAAPGCSGSESLSASALPDCEAATAERRRAS